MLCTSTSCYSPMQVSLVPPMWDVGGSNMAEVLDRGKVVVEDFKGNGAKPLLDHQARPYLIYWANETTLEYWEHSGELFRWRISDPTPPSPLLSEPPPHQNDPTGQNWSVLSSVSYRWALLVRCPYSSVPAAATHDILLYKVDAHHFETYLTPPHHCHHFASLMTFTHHVHVITVETSPGPNHPYQVYSPIFF